ncbi:uncharacterized protein N7479_009674 [Penicillium vulpinum]|uniref:Uncharacterized protein n=1 Tax=Penicillium vulpinum TaxID=29845 RepID=A0A1V6RF34_9EURO|nr:uncharacterized protein N7479_009674 [Penicillium vulpinum]KAJ5951261.1 hypothetical protein N7479_009674 [Penicillium vulpinum]OQE00392.1 hypothetical protein PENVUL_c052G04730 [Penicillium vulpinum]
MGPIDTNYPAFGFDQPGFDSQALFNGFANLGSDGQLNGSNAFSQFGNGEMCSFDELFSGIPLNGVDQSGSGMVPPMGVGSFNSGQPGFNALPTESPLNNFNQLSNTPVYGATQFTATASSCGFGQPALSATNSFDKPNQATPVNKPVRGAAQFAATASSCASGQPALSDMNSFNKPNSTTPVNRSAQPVSNNVPMHAPYRQVPYDPSVGIAYSPEDTDADKVQKWENLIAQANLANAGVSACTPQIIEEDTVEEGPQDVDSPNSLFDSPHPSPDPSPVEIVDTPSPTPPTPSPPQALAATMTSSKAATNVTANTFPRTVQLPRALTNQKGYAQHVSPFAPVATLAPPSASTPTSRQLEAARERIQSLSKERNLYQRNLRKATIIDPKTGKTSLQMLQTENTSLRRTNARQSRENDKLKQELQATNKSFTALVDRYNHTIKQLHKAQLDLKQLGK